MLSEVTYSVFLTDDINVVVLKAKDYDRTQDRVLRAWLMWLSIS